MFRKGDVIASFFSIDRNLGNGAFGEVYAGTDTRTGARVAIKVENVHCSCPQLLYESRVLQELQGHKGIPRRYWFGQEGDSNVLIMQRLGKCLVEAYLSVPEAFVVAQQILERLQVLHSAGFAYRDMKPDNFVYGCGKHESVLFMIDFGLCKRVVDPATKIHITHRGGKSLSGTPRYASLHTHDGEEQSRRDDIESLGYMLVYLVKGSLPWQGLSARNNFAAVSRVKRTTSLDDLCAELPSAFKKTILYGRELPFTDMPDYTYLYSLWSCPDKK